MKELEELTTEQQIKNFIEGKDKEGKDIKLASKGKEEQTIIVTTLFPTPAIVINIDRSFTKDELQFFLTDIPMHKLKNRTVHQSKDFQIFDTFAEELKDIKTFCEYHLKKYLEEVEGADTELCELRITESWLNKMKPQEYMERHHHPNSYLSGVFYIRCLSPDSIDFNNRRWRVQNMQFPTKKATAWNIENVGYNIKEGDLILFPSNMSHSVNLNETKDRERISIGFNTFPKGEMGMINGNRLKL